MTLSNKKANLIRDLQRHFGHRIKQQIYDIGTTAKAADLEPGYVLKLVMTELMFELVRSAVTIAMDEGEFLQLCELGWQSMAEEASNALAQALEN